MQFQYHQDGTVPENDGRTVFVFGSNLSGIHGAGAAAVAHQKFQANWHKGQGWVSLFAYAIPTKERNVREPRSLDDIRASIEEFCTLTWEFSPHIQFFITRVGCGYAGYKDDQIAPLFRGANPENCSFPDTWAEILEGSKSHEEAADESPEFAVVAHLNDLMGATRKLHLKDMEIECRNCIASARERVRYLVGKEVPEIKRGINSTSATIQFLDMAGLLEPTQRNEMIATIRTLNRVRHKQREELKWLATEQRFNKRSLATILRLQSGLPG